MKKQVAALALLIPISSLGSTIGTIQSVAQAAAGCHVDGVGVGLISDKSTWRVDFGAGCTTDQQAAGLAAVNAISLPVVDSSVPLPGAVAASDSYKANIAKQAADLAAKGKQYDAFLLLLKAQGTKP